MNMKIILVVCFPLIKNIVKEYRRGNYALIFMMKLIVFSMINVSGWNVAKKIPRKCVIINVKIKSAKIMNVMKISKQ